MDGALKLDRTELESTGMCLLAPEIGQVKRAIFCQIFKVKMSQNLVFKVKCFS